MSRTEWGLPRVSLHKPPSEAKSWEPKARYEQPHKPGLNSHCSELVKPVNVLITPVHMSVLQCWENDRHQPMTPAHYIISPGSEDKRALTQALT